MHILGLTGGIACGKSHVSAVLASLGARVIDGDVLSRELTAPGGAALPMILDAFGPGVFHPGGALNRRALADRIYSSDKQRETLDRIMQPMLRGHILRDIQKARDDGAAVCVLDMPLLYEKNLDELCDTVWAVYVPEDEQMRRLMDRDGLTPEQAAARLRSQLPALEKARRADAVIDTSGSREETAARIPVMLQKLTAGKEQP